MAEKAPGSRLLWQAWALVGLVASGVSGARLVLRPRTVAAAPTASIAAKVQTTPRVEVEMARATPIGDALLAQLGAAETSSEECELMQRLPPAEDPAATYAIADVLDRTRFRSVRACATAALTLQPTPPARSWLIDLADDPDPNVHGPALEALAANGDGAARAVVVEAAHSDDLDIRASAVIALLDARSADAYGAAVELLGLVDTRETSGSLVDALGKSQDARALPVLTALVANADTETHLRAISALGDLGQKKAEALLSSLLEVGSDDEYRAAAKALVRLSPETALAKLRVALASSNDERRQTALSEILDSKLPGVTPILVAALRGDDPVLARGALQYVTRAPDAALEPDIVALLERDDPQLQRLAVRALSRLRSPSAIDALQKLSSSDTLGNWARRELDRLPGTPEEIRARRIRDLEHGGTSVLGALAEDTSAAAQSALLSYFSKPETSSAELPRVVERAPASTVEELVRTASASGTPNRQALVAGLVARGDPKFVDLLRSAAHDQDDETRHTALQGLVQLGDGESRPLLEDLVRATDPSERAFAAELLGQRPDTDTLPLLEALAQDPDAAVVTAALGQLEIHAPDRAILLAKRAYEAASSDDRPSLLSSLGSLRSGLAMPLYDLALQDRDENVVLNGVRMLGGTQSVAGARRLLAVATDASRSDEVREEAARALRELGGPLVRANVALLDQLAPRGAAEAFTCAAR